MRYEGHRVLLIFLGALVWTLFWLSGNRFFDVVFNGLELFVIILGMDFFFILINKGEWLE